MRTYNVVPLRNVETGPTHPVLMERGERWMTLADAASAGVDLAYVQDGIGPRVRGMVYLGGYCHDISTVHDVFVLVKEAGFDFHEDKLMPRRAVGWEVAEESADDHGRVRRHCTSWEYDIRNTPLFMAVASGS